MSTPSSLSGYISVTAAYWGFTLTDGALRMLVLLHFYTLGYTPFQLAFLFVLYELMGVLTNLFGGWLGARFGLSRTLYAGLLIQVGALMMLSFVDPNWVLVLSVAYVVAAQGLSGVAKDLTKMSAKSALKLVVPKGADGQAAHGLLFRWVAVLTGSKNALKGVGFFLGSLLLATIGFQLALWSMAGALALVFVGVMLSVPRNLGRVEAGVPFSRLFSKTPAINRLSAARLFLFAARDVWFVVGVPVFLYSVLDWSFTQVGTFMAAWVIGYGFVQSLAPAIIKHSEDGRSAESGAAPLWAFALAATPLLIIAGFALPEPYALPPGILIVGGLALFGIVFAVNSSLHSYLILALTDRDEDVALNVGFYYMANAGGRLVGTLLSGITYQVFGIEGALGAAAAMAAISGLLAVGLRSPKVRPSALAPDGPDQNS